MSHLFPPEIETLADLPYNIHDAIRMALVFLSFEELPKDERPPKRIWMDGERMTLWWEEVERKREDKYGSGSSNGAGGGKMSQNAVLDEMGLR